MGHVTSVPFFFGQTNARNQQLWNGDFVWRELRSERVRLQAAFHCVNFRFESGQVVAAIRQDRT